MASHVYLTSYTMTGQLAILAYTLAGKLPSFIAFSISRDDIIIRIIFYGQRGARVTKKARVIILKPRMRMLRTFLLLLHVCTC